MFREFGLIGTFGPCGFRLGLATFSIFLSHHDHSSRTGRCRPHRWLWSLWHFPAHHASFGHSALLVVLLHFMFVWNDFVGPLIFLSHRDQFTLALGLQLFMSRLGTTPWHLLMAATTLMVGPVLVLFF